MFGFANNCSEDGFSCLLAVKSLAIHLAVFFAILCFSDQCFPQDRPMVMDREQQLRDQWAKQHENIRALGDRIHVEKLPYFYLDELLRESFTGTVGYFLSNHDRQYSLFCDDSFCKELGLNQKQFEILHGSAMQLERDWPKIIRRYSKTGNPNSVDAFEQSIERFESEVTRLLDQNQLTRLNLIRLRQQIQTEGVPRFLVSEQVRLGLKKESVEIINQEVRQKALVACRNANKKFIEEIQAILPGYLDEFDEISMGLLPLLPLEAFVVLANSSDPVNLASWEMVELLEIELMKGEWVFSSPRFGRSIAGQVKVDRFSNFDGVPQIPWLSFRKHFGHPLTSDQLLEFDSISAQIEQNLKSETRHLANVANPDREREFQILYHKINQAGIDSVKSQLLPQQTASVFNYLRLHALFTLGPKFIHENAKLPGFSSREQFHGDLEEMNTNLLELIKRTRTELIDEIVGSVNELSQIDGSDPVLEPNMLAAPQSTIYESFFRPILHLENFEIGKE